MSTKRQDYISWDEYFMGVAMLSGMRSKDPNTQVGACIVSDKHKILSMGYNGFPTGCSDDDFPWVRPRDSQRDAAVLLLCLRRNQHIRLPYGVDGLDGQKLRITGPDPDTKKNPILHRKYPTNMITNPF